MDPTEVEAMNLKEKALTTNTTTFDNLRPRKLPILRRLSYFVKINPTSENTSSCDPLDQLVHPITVEGDAVNLSFAMLSDFNF